jgi:murein DD-endopeptidase MepM/ murein hydrolase activator NlpD
MRRWLTAVALLGSSIALAQPAQAQRHYTVRHGDTLVTIARRHRIGVDDIQDANRLRSERIRPGMRLRIPARASGRRVWDGVYVVREGDTLARIARRFGVSIRNVQRENGLRGTAIRPGARLRIPGRGMGRQRPQGAAPAELDDSQRQALARAEELGLGTSRVVHKLLVQPPDPSWIAAAGTRDREGTVLAPVDDGVFLRGFGAGAGAYHQALDIGAEQGTPVRAAASGIVAYAGRAVRGYGNVVVMVHPNGWVTWYAHNRQNLVVAGQLVRRGDIVATVGATGYARGTHVHFMLMYEGEHCDPMPVLDGSFSNRTGDPLAEQEHVRWTGERPSAVRCAPKRAHPRRNRRRRARR